YNEYGDLIEWRSTSFTFPDANGNQTETVSNYLYPHVYDEIYGLIEKKTYIGNTFYDGRKYTDFAYYVSVPEIESLSKQALNISPNPATGNVSISASETIKELQIFNSNGKLVNKQAVANEKITFDVTILTQGIYLVRAILENNDTQTGKLIVE
ncbi:MAG: T9SS type A sorting domain-containing protein, partial [Lentimicrobiaceae bacterium]|nr:T9SS type A sorting domain-containing protein [Lentimicrobiaceae bacterium]